MESFAISVKNVIKQFSDYSLDGKKFNAVNDVSFNILQGSLTIIAGQNGSGKSVLMQLISGLLEPTKGSITTTSNPGLIFQEAGSQILGQTPFEDVAVGPKNQKVPKKQIPQIVENTLQSVSLLEKANAPAEFLSGGEKRRLAVASILAMKKDILIFDEPYANLDFPSIREVNQLIINLKNNGKTIIILTHEIEKCLALSDHFIILEKGKIVFDGKAQDALNNDLEKWGIKNPITAYNSLKDLVW